MAEGDVFGLKRKWFNAIASRRKLKIVWKDESGQVDVAYSDKAGVHPTSYQVMLYDYEPAIAIKPEWITDVSIIGGFTGPKGKE